MENELGKGYAKKKKRQYDIRFTHTLKERNYKPPRTEKKWWQELLRKERKEMLYENKKYWVK